MIRSIPNNPYLRHVSNRVTSGDTGLADHVFLHSEALLNERNDAAPVVFLSGAEEPSSRWPVELLVELAQLTGGSIWFDTRDIGQSSWVDEPYELADLIVDTLHVLDAYDVPTAHFVGRGMGGQIAQQLTLAVPERVSSLTLLSSTPGRRDDFGDPADWLVDKMSERLFADPPTDADEVAEWITDQLEWFNGPVFNFDREATLAQMYDEIADGWRGPNGHGLVVVEAPDVVDFLVNITKPALVVHGTSDPVYPVPHAQGLANRLPNSQLVLVEGLGHELPNQFVPQLVALMSEHVLSDTP